MPSHSPLTRRRHAHVRRARVRRRRNRVATVLAVLVTVAALLAACIGGGSTSRPDRKNPSASTSPGSGRASREPKTIAAAESGLLPWTLPVPLSRAVALPGPGGLLTVLGGLTTSNASAQGIYTLDPATGKLAHVANLSGGLHDSSGAVINGQDVTFGGGSPATVATVQAVPTPTASGPGTIAAAVVTGKLPRPRSDSATVTIGTTTYIVGGYDGTNADPTVLATTDGSRFSTVASLPVPVRYPAVASSERAHLRVRWPGDRRCPCRPARE